MQREAEKRHNQELIQSVAAAVCHRDLSHMVTSQLASRSAIIREFLEGFRPWIETVLQVGFAEAIMFEFGFSLAGIAAPHLVTNRLLIRCEDTPAAGLQNLLDSVELPPGFLPAIAVSAKRKPGGCLKKRKPLWSAEWRDCPVALRLRGLAGPIVVARFPYSRGPHDCNWDEIVLTAKTNAAGLLQLIQSVTETTKTPRLHVMGVGFQKVPYCTWDDLVLDPSIIQLVKRGNHAAPSFCPNVCCVKDTMSSASPVTVMTPSSFNSSIAARTCAGASEYNRGGPPKTVDLGDLGSSIDSRRGVYSHRSVFLFKRISRCDLGRCYFSNCPFRSRCSQITSDDPFLVVKWT